MIIKRKIILFLNLLRNFFIRWTNYSFSFAIYDLLWWLCFYIRPPFTLKVSAFALKKKTKWLDHYIEHNYSDILDHFKNDKIVLTHTKGQYIWVFWGQGEKQMPPLIKACYKQLVHFNSNVILVTYQNLSDYINLSPIIYKKVKNGQICWANFSDIIRNTLLAKYGGLWLDATVWVSGKLPIDKLSQMEFFTANGCVEKRTKKSVFFWTSDRWNWSSWCLWSRESGYKLYNFVSEMLQAIAIRESYWPDYVIQDYLIHYACRNYKNIRHDMESITIHNPYRYDLLKIIERPYNEYTYNQIVKSDFVFKLAYRTPKKQNSQGNPTLYGKMLQGIIRFK